MGGPPFTTFYTLNILFIQLHSLIFCGFQPITFSRQFWWRAVYSSSPILASSQKQARSRLPYPSLPSRLPAQVERERMSVAVQESRQRRARAGRRGQPGCTVRAVTVFYGDLLTPVGAGSQNQETCFLCALGLKERVTIPCVNSP